MPPKKDTAKIWSELSLAVQNFGSVPSRSRDPQREVEDKLRRKIDRAKQTGVLTAEQYLSLTTTAEDNDAARTHSKLLCRKLWVEVQEFGCVPLRSKHEGRRQEDNLRKRIQHAKETIPHFAEDWRSITFEGLKQDVEQLIKDAERKKQFVMQQ